MNFPIAPTLRAATTVTVNLVLLVMDSTAVTSMSVNQKNIPVMLMQTASIHQVTMTVNAKMVSPVTDLNALISMNVN